MSELMHIFACRLFIIQRMGCIIIFLLGALVACGPAKESWSMFIIKTSPCALTVPTKCAALNCTTTISTCLRPTEESSHPSTQAVWHRHLQRFSLQDVFGHADFFAAHLKLKLIRERVKRKEPGLSRYFKLRRRLSVSISSMREKARACAQDMFNKSSRRVSFAS